MAEADLYTLTSDTVETPPSALGAALKRIGPGMVLAASIVGSGELIATTTLGAQVGYAALWIIVVSCAIKPVVQGELGRYTIATGRDRARGLRPRARARAPGVNWLVLGAGLLTVLLTLLQVGGMFGGVAQVLHLLVPAVSVNVWVGICLVLTLALLLGGGYSRIEKLAVIKVGFFTCSPSAPRPCCCGRRARSSAHDLADGMSLHLPAGGLATAIAVFGITGVGATELVMYPYWCVEKGYARFAGRATARRRGCRGRAAGSA